MAVVTQFVVVRDGVEKMTFTSKKEADAYDKQLDIAENLADFMEKAELEISEPALEELAMYLAKHSQEVSQLLKGSKPKASKSSSESKSAKAKEPENRDSGRAEADEAEGSEEKAEARQDEKSRNEAA